MFLRRNKKLLGAPGLTRNKKLLVTRENDIVFIFLSFSGSPFEVPDRNLDVEVLGLEPSIHSV